MKIWGREDIEGGVEKGWEGRKGEKECISPAFENIGGLVICPKLHRNSDGREEFYGDSKVQKVLNSSPTFKGHQISDFKTEMHQIRFPQQLCARKH